MKISVLNPDGRDPDQLFPDYAGTPDDSQHAPVNFHAYAACTRGSFHRKVAGIPAEQRQVLLLLRQDLKYSLKVLQELKAAGKIVAVTWKESGRHQVASQMNDAANLQHFREICTAAHGAISSTPEQVLLYRAAGARFVEYIPTPYPVDIEAWDFSVTVGSRRGVFIGTREWDVPTRNHAMALLVAKTFDAPVTVINTDGRSGRKKLESLGIQRLEVIEGPVSYTEYLRVIARHVLVWQLDASGVPGQVAGDAALCRVLCVGGDGAVNREVFPNLSGHRADPGSLAHAAGQILRDHRQYDSELKCATTLARERISFSAITERLHQFFAQIAR